MIHKPIGGVRSVELRATAAVGVEALSVEVALIDDRLSYVQHLCADKGTIVVEHTLELVARRNDARQWMDNAFVERAVLQGLQASITLNDGREIELGVCDTTLYATPLRLVSLLSDSARSVAYEPTVTLTLRSQDTKIR